MNELKGDGKVIAVLETRSNTKRMGLHKDRLSATLQQADEVLLYQPEGMDWTLDDVAAQSAVPVTVYSSTDEIIEAVKSKVSSGDHVLIMSNGGFEAIHQRMLDAL